MSSIQKYLGISKDQVEFGLELHRKSIVIDPICVDPVVWSDAQVNTLDEMLEGHRPFREIDEAISGMRLNEILTPGHPSQRKWVEQIKKSGVTCINGQIGGNTMDEALRNILLLYFKFNRLSDFIMSATSVNDVERAKREGKLAIGPLSSQKSDMIERNLDNLDKLYRYGLRMLNFTYNVKNYAADGCTEPGDGGLSNFGVLMVERMNKLGIIIDTTHSSEKTALDAAEISKDPIVSSHTCCKALHNHDRCQSDEVLKVIAEKGGVMGVCSLPYFLAPIIGKKAGTLKTWLDHIDHCVELVGIDHVGVSTDLRDRPGCPERWGEAQAQNRLANHTHGWQPRHKFDYSPSSEAGWFPSPDKILAWSNWPNYTIGLVSRGYSDKEVQMIIGRNWLNFYKRVIGF